MGRVPAWRYAEDNAAGSRHSPGRATVEQRPQRSCVQDSARTTALNRRATPTQIMPRSLELTPETTRHSPLTSQRPQREGADPALVTLWQAVLRRLGDDPSISRANFATWLRGTKLLERDGDALVVGAQHTFALEK